MPSLYSIYNMTSLQRCEHVYARNRYRKKYLRLKPVFSDIINAISFRLRPCLLVSDVALCMV